MEQKLVQLQKKLEADQSLGEKLLSLETPEEVQGSLKEQGLDFTLEEINTLREALVKFWEKGATDQLSEEDLEDVAGGFPVVGTIVATCAVISATAAVATATHKITGGRW